MFSDCILLFLLLLFVCFNWKRAPVGLYQSGKHARKPAICFCKMREENNLSMVALCLRSYRASIMTKTEYFLITWLKWEALTLLCRLEALPVGALPFRRAKLKATSARARGRVSGCDWYLKACPRQGWGLLTLGRDLLPAPPCVPTQDVGWILPQRSKRASQLCNDQDTPTPRQKNQPVSTLFPSHSLVVMDPQLTETFP